MVILFLTQYKLGCSGYSVVHTMSSIRKLYSFSRVVWSLIRYGEVTIKTYALRRAECVDCTFFKEAKRGIYCSANGYPRWYLSDLRTKWRMPTAKCPLNKW
jgi:hypothetical protein